MDIQFIIAIGIAIAAISYIALSFVKQLKEVEKDPKCDDCPVIDIERDQK